MATAAATLMILSALALVPISLVRAVLGASWSMIARAYLVWVALLIVMFQPRWTPNDMNLGWAFVFAVFLTVPAIFVLSLVQKLIIGISTIAQRWGQWPDQNDKSFNAHRASTLRPPHQAQMPPQDKAVVPAQQPAVLQRLLYALFGQHWPITLGILLLIGASLSFAHLYHRAALLAAAQELFALPPSTRFADIRSIGKSSARRPQFDAVIRLTDEDYKAFASKLDAPQAWPADNIFFNDQHVQPASADVRRWDDWPMPAIAHRSRLNVSTLSRQALGALRAGRVQCYAIVQIRQPTAERGMPRSGPTYTAKSCQDTERQDRRVAWRMAVLDPASRTLYLTVR